MATCNVEELMEAGACFACLPPNQQDIIELQLLCEIVDSGGGGGGGGGGGATAPLIGVVDPEGAVTAEPGTPYTNTANVTFWIKMSGSGNTGWNQFV